ncbi:MAG: bifunctional nuclease family protein [Actinobacteria bacterium]|nr:bifunctional nuclease family protein [Actinomycetota bacterium]
MIPVEVVGVRVEMPSNQPIVLLKEIDGLRFLPIWVGSAEATAIAFAQQGVEPPRPLTHDLMVTVLGSLGATLESVHLTHLQDGIFYAELNLLDSARSKITVSSRPSDAIALALRTNCGIFSSIELLEESGIEIPVDDGVQANEEVERFREFLDQITPEDFAG